MRTAGLVLLCVGLLAGVAHASPFVVAASYTAQAILPAYFRVSLDGGAEGVSPPFSGTLSDGTVLANTLRHDVGGVTVGAHVLSVRACVGDPLWATEVCSAAAPFSFTRPAPPPGPPSGLTGFTLRP